MEVRLNRYQKMLIAKAKAMKPQNRGLKDDTGKRVEKPKKELQDDSRQVMTSKFSCFFYRDASCRLVTMNSDS